jgi:hypothetical protein
MRVPQGVDIYFKRRKLKAGAEVPKELEDQVKAAKAFLDSKKAAKKTKSAVKGETKK